MSVGTNILEFDKNTNKVHKFYDGVKITGTRQLNDPLGSEIRNQLPCEGLRQLALRRA